MKKYFNDKQISKYIYFPYTAKTVHQAIEANIRMSLDNNPVLSEFLLSTKSIFKDL